MAKAKGSARQTRSRAGGREYLVQDRAAFAAVLTDAITLVFGGNRSEAARSVGLSQSTLRNYCEAKCAAIRYETLRRLTRLVGRGQIGTARQERLEAALLSPDARDRLDRYKKWVSGETRAILAAGRPLGQLGDGAPTHDRESAQRQREWEGAMEALRIARRKWPSYWAPLDKKMAKLGLSRNRALLAQLRVLGPLFSHRASSGIELGWDELYERDEEALRRFLDAGVSREVILLDRASDVARAQDADSGLFWLRT